MNRFEKLEYLIEPCSSEFIKECQFLDEMVSWMSEDQFDAFYEHVCSCWDIKTQDQDQEELDEELDDAMNEFTVEDDEMIPA